MNKNVRIYEIKSSSVENSKKLFSSDNKHFFWDDDQFTHFKEGDYVFIVNRYEKWNLFTKIDTVGIETQWNNDKAPATSSFTFEGDSFEVEDKERKYERFIRFQIIQRKTWDNDWNFTTIMGSSQTYDLWRVDKKLDSVDRRLEKINDMMKIFDGGQSYQVLRDARRKLFTSQPTDKSIVHGLQTEDFQKLINEENFLFQRLIDHWKEFKSYQLSDNQLKRIKELNEKSDSFTGLLSKFEDGSEIYNFVDLLGRLISYIDTRAANKLEYNKNPDHLALAGTFVRQDNWVRNLVDYKLAGNTTDPISSPSINNVIVYIENPRKGFAITSENLREQIAKNILKIENYRKEEFLDDILAFFKPYNIDTANPDNYTFILSKVFYDIEEVESRLKGDSENDVPAPIKHMDVIDHVKSFMTSKGFNYSIKDLYNFYLSLKSKPFVLLAGISGTGKTQLPRMFAKAVGMKEDQVIQVPVRPDWTDGSDLLGYTGLNGKFQPKGLTLAIDDAKKSPEKPFFFILDEMNLARVEHYFSEFLSVIETRKREDNGAITTDRILRKEMIINAENRKEFDDLRWPENLYLIGTVNMDETTFSFSRKVLDRANTVEMNQVDLSFAPAPEEEVEAIEGITNSLFKTEYISSTELINDDRKHLENVIKLLIEINQILKAGDLHFAYRVRDEISFYMTMNRKYGLLSEKDALDYQIMQKVLPRIHGSSIRVQRILVQLLKKLNGLKELNEDTPDLSHDEELTKRINESDFPRSGTKLLFMLQRFEEDRFTSFWV